MPQNIEECFDSVRSISLPATRVVEIRIQLIESAHSIKQFSTLQFHPESALQLSVARLPRSSYPTTLEGARRQHSLTL